MVKKKILTITIVALLSVSLIGLGLTQTQAMSRILAIGPGGAKDVGSSFTTTETVTRSDLVGFHSEVKKAEKSESFLNSVRYGIVSAAVVHPIAKTVNKSLNLGAASGVISWLITDKGLKSENIQDVLNKSTAKNFNVKINYKKKSRGQDNWYEATGMTITPA